MLRKILTGQRFERLLVIGYAENATRSSWHCLCDCKTVTKVSTSNLVSGHTTSCGCWRREVISLTKNKGRGRDGPYGREYIVWQHMKSRCNNPKNKDYKNYGERGISVCERWLDFDAFIADMGKKPSPNHTLERVDNDGDYCPENCKWATREEQNNNSRNNHWIDYQGERVTIRQFTSRVGLSKSSFNNRVRYGWCMDCITSQPKRGTCVHKKEG